MNPAQSLPAYRPLFVHKVNHEHLALVRRAIAERQRNESSFEVRGAERRAGRG